MGKNNQIIFMREDFIDSMENLLSNSNTDTSHTICLFNRLLSFVEISNKKGKIKNYLLTIQELLKNNQTKTSLEELIRVGILKIEQDDLIILPQKFLKFTAVKENFSHKGIKI